MELTTKLAGARVVLVMGHSACGAVAGEIADLEKAGAVKIAGAFYDLQTGSVEFFA
jgi:carbonic anhydrase